MYVLAVSFPVRVIVVKTISHWGNSFLILFKRGIEQNTSPTDAAWTHIGLFEGESWEKSHPLNQLPSKTPVDKSPEHEVRRSENKEKREKDVVE